MDQHGVSIIVPFLNEQEGMERFCGVIDNYAAKMPFPIEVIFVDDGSVDGSVDIIKGFKFDALCKIRIVRFTKNFGSLAAIRAGILKAEYDICTWIGADLQEPLEMIEKAFPRLMGACCDIVYVVKGEVAVNPISRFFSKQYYRLMRKYAVTNFPSSGIGALVFGKKVKDYLNGNVEINSTIVLQLLNAGFKYELLQMDFSARETGHSKWTFSKKIKTLIDSFVSFSYMPIRLVSIIGVCIFLIGIISAVITVINKLVNPQIPVGYSTVVSILEMGFGITNISLGIIAEYLWRTFDVSRGRPPFIISDDIIVKENG